MPPMNHEPSMLTEVAASNAAAAVSSAAGLILHGHDPTFHISMHVGTMLDPPYETKHEQRTRQAQWHKF